MSDQPNGSSRGRQGLGRGRIIRNRSQRNDEFTSSSDDDNDDNENGAFSLPDINPRPRPEMQEGGSSEVDQLLNYDLQDLTLSSGDEKEEKYEKYEEVMTANRKMQERKFSTEVDQLLNYDLQDLTLSSGDEKEEKYEEVMTANRKMQERKVPTAEEQREADRKRRSRRAHRLRDYDEYTEDFDDSPVEKPKIVDSDEEARAFSSIPFVDNSFLTTRRTQLPLEAIRAVAPQPPVQVPAPRRQSQNRERKPRGKRPGPPRK